MKVKVVVVLLLGLLLLTGGALVFHFIPVIVQKTVKDTLKLDGPRSSLYKSFVNSSKDVTVYATHYVYHVTNPYDVMHNAAWPIFQEKGPYTYIEIEPKPQESISWFPNGTVQYKYNTSYIFEPSLSLGNLESDPVTILDLGFLLALYKFRNLSNITDAISEAAALEVASLLGVNMFTNTTAGGALWGYNNTFLSVMDPTHGPVSVASNPDASTMAGFSKAYSGGDAAEDLPAPPPNSVLTMTAWNGMDTYLDNDTYWKTPYANKINGTDGTSFWPGITKFDSPYVFVDDLYRSVKLVSQGTTTYEGVELIRLVLAREDMESQWVRPKNADFFMNTTGFIPVPPGAKKPMFFSKPHFLGADMENVRVHILPDDDFSNQDRYDTFLDVESITGQLFKVNKRIQLNMWIDSIKLNGSTTPIVPTYMPIFWVDENMLLPDNLLDDYKKEIQLPMRASFAGGIVAMILGIGLLIVAVVLQLRTRRNEGFPRDDTFGDSLVQQSD